MNKYLPLLAATVLLTACAAPQPTAKPSPPRPPEPDTIVAPPPQFGPSVAKVNRVNPQHRFVVLDFTGRVMPPIGTKVNVYRDDQRVGLVQITEPVRANFATADILEGELRVGDEAR